MFNSLASYLLGYPTAAVAAEATPAEPLSATATVGSAATPILSAQVPCSDEGLFTKETDDDWLLIEKTEDESSGRSSKPASATSSAVAIPGATPVHLTLAVSAYPCEDASIGVPCMEESWFVTPPPCFSSGSVPVETSPLENLLIEHPSMSVYHRSPVPVATPTLSSSVGAVATPSQPQRANPAATFRKLSRPVAMPVPRSRRSEAGSGPATAAPAPVAATTQVPATASTGATAVPVQVPEVPVGDVGRRAVASPTRGAAANTAVQASPRRPNAYSPYQQQQQSLQIRSAQKLVQRATCQLVKRDAMERTNKAREILSSRNKRQRRSDRMHNHSGANNNRKC